MKMTNNKKNKTDFVDELMSTLPLDRAENAQREAQKEILQIRLAELRENLGIRQKDIKSFSQSGVSKLESRKDMKISTLIEYLGNLGLSVEIKVYPKNKKKISEEIVLLKE